MKQLIIILLVTMFTAMVATGCSARYPAVRIDPAPLESVACIDIGSRYEYIDFDVVTTDSGKDVIVHFALEEENNE